MKTSHAALPLLGLLCLLGASARAEDTAKPAAPPAVSEDVLDHLTQPSANARITASVLVRVADEEVAIKALLQEVGALGGFLANRQDSTLSLRVPTAKTGALLATVHGLGKVSEKSYGSEDQARRLLELEARLKARQQMVDRYFEVMNAANAYGVLQVEAHLAQLISEIEQLQGQLRLLRYQLTWADVTVRFQFESRRAPELDASSPFAWITGRNLVTLLDSFVYGRGPR